MKSIICNISLFGGLVAVFVGLWWECPSAALIVVGAVMFWAGYKSVQGAGDKP